MPGAVVVLLAAAHDTIRLRLVQLMRGQPQNVIFNPLRLNTTAATFELTLRDNLTRLRRSMSGIIPVIAVMDRISEQALALATRLNVSCGNAMAMAELSSHEVRLEFIAPVPARETEMVGEMQRLISAVGNVGRMAYLVVAETGADTEIQIARCTSLFITAEKSRMWPHKSFTTLRQETSRVYMVDTRLEPVPEVGELAESLLLSALWQAMFSAQEQADKKRLSAATELLRAKCDTPARHLLESFQDLRRDFFNTILPRICMLLGPAQSLRARQVEFKNLARDLYLPAEGAAKTSPRFQSGRNTGAASSLFGMDKPVLAEILEQLAEELAGATPAAVAPLPEFLRAYENEVREDVREQAAEVLAGYPFPIFLFLPPQSQPLATADPLFFANRQALSNLKQALARITYEVFRGRIAGYDESETRLGEFQLERPVWRLFLPKEFSFDHNDECHHSPLMGWVGFRKLM
jgi:hypothetical protein